MTRTYSNFDNTGLTDDYEYFAFWYKGDPAVSTIYVWLYWSSSQDSKPIDVSAVPTSGGYVYLPVSSWSHTATEFTQFAIGVNQPSDDYDVTIFIDDVQFVTDPAALS